MEEIVHYKVNPEVVLTDKLKIWLKALADEYFTTTNQIVLVTSGLRTNENQASAMYDNYKAKNNVQYAQVELEQQIAAVFNKYYVMPNTPREVTVKMMQNKIDEQTSKGLYISAHMKGNAIDFSKDMNIPTFMTICRKHNYFVYEEIPCVHVTFV